MRATRSRHTAGGEPTCQPGCHWPRLRCPLHSGAVTVTTDAATLQLVRESNRYGRTMFVAFDPGGGEWKLTGCTVEPPTPAPPTAEQGREPRKPGEFRVGDRVRCVDHHGSDLALGGDYVVSKLKDSLELYVHSSALSWRRDRFELIELIAAPEQEPQATESAQGRVLTKPSLLERLKAQRAERQP